MDCKDKIRKLLALAKSPEPEEAKLTLLKARKLMAEHKLTERDLEERNTTVIKRAIGETFSKKANSWMDPLSIIIGENYCCSAFRCKISAKTTVWHVGFIGLEGDFEICVKIFRYAVRCVKSEQKKLRKQHRDYYTPQTIAKTTTLYNGDSAPEAEKSVTSEPKQAAPVVSTADKTPPKEAGKLAYARRRKGAHAPALPEMQERVCTVLARTANDQRVPEVRRENPAGRAGTVRVHLPGLQEGELRSDERRGRRNRKREVLLRLRPEHPEAHVEPGQALLYDVRRAG